MSGDQGFELAYPTDQAEAQVLRDIASVGWHVMIVRGPEGEDLKGSARFAGLAERSFLAYRANFAYTVGFEFTFGHPEVVLVGDWQYARDCLNAVGDLISEGLGFKSGDETADVLEGLAVRFGDVGERERRELLTWAEWAYRGGPFRAVQLLLPDAHGRWPNLASYQSKAQPLLG